MSEFRPYFEQLLHKHRINVAKHHIHLFDGFVKEPSIVEAFDLIRNTQLTMIEKWKEKTKIEDIKSKQIVLANGTVGKPYEFVFDFDNLKLNDIGEFKIEIDEKLGIIFDKTERKLSGIPQAAGEHILRMEFNLVSESDVAPFHKKDIKLIVNPDPKSLWKNDPTPKDIEYWKEDDESASVTFGERKLIVGSKRGRSHAHEAKPRDDAFKFAFHDSTGWGVIAVADGAGSAKFSRKGSEIACQTVLEHFDKIDAEKLKEIEDSIQEVINNPTEDNQKRLSGYFIDQLGKAAFAAQGKIREEAVAKKTEMREFSTTLIFALVKKYSNKYVVASFWVGDGGIGIYNKEKNEVFPLGIPDSGEFAGQTRFLTMSEIFADGAYASRVRFKIMDDFTALILMTDGITDPKFQTDANLKEAKKWNELWDDLNGQNQDNCKVDFEKPIEEVKEDLMKWLDFWSPGNHDDRTIAILY